MALEAAERLVLLSQRTLYRGRSRAPSDTYGPRGPPCAREVFPLAFRGAPRTLASPPSALPAQRHLLHRPRRSHMFMVVI
ncbi:hypothetical protein K523DRAFT_320065 [Schizophyllum commune Tattone D]|nr:hypothetical protein K523DRAFT_320065 [Schizophyllum commune Tattone D]